MDVVLAGREARGRARRDDVAAADRVDRREAAACGQGDTGDGVARLKVRHAVAAAQSCVEGIDGAVGLGLRQRRDRQDRLSGDCRLHRVGGNGACVGGRCVSHGSGVEVGLGNVIWLRARVNGLVGQSAGAAVEPRAAVDLVVGDLREGKRAGGGTTRVGDGVRVGDRLIERGEDRGAGALRQRQGLNVVDEAIDVCGTDRNAVDSVEVVRVKLVLVAMEGAEPGPVGLRGLCDPEGRPAVTVVGKCEQRHVERDDGNAARAGRVGGLLAGGEGGATHVAGAQVERPTGGPHTVGGRRVSGDVQLVDGVGVVELGGVPECVVGLRGIRVQAVGGNVGVVRAHGGDQVEPRRGDGLGDRRRSARVVGAAAAI